MRAIQRLKWKTIVMSGMFVLAQILGVPQSAQAQSTAPLVSPPVSPLLEDFEDGAPDGWFTYADTANSVVAASFPAVDQLDPLALPGQATFNGLLFMEATVPTWGGCGVQFAAQDWSNADAISFWLYSEDPDLTLELEIQTASNDDRRVTIENDRAGWQLHVFPFSTFGGGGAFDVSQVDTWVLVMDGVDGFFALDDFRLVNLEPVTDFETGLPDGWFSYQDSGASTINASVVTVSDTDPNALPGQIGATNQLSITANVPTWGGFGDQFDSPRNWSVFAAISFWFLGSASDKTYVIELQTASGAFRRASFVDSFTGWKKVVLPFVTFGSDSSFDVSNVDAWIFVLDGIISGFSMDDLELVEFINPAFDVGGVVNGLAGSGLVLQNEGADDLEVEGDGDFTFSMPLSAGSPYSVTVHKQPQAPAQFCQVSNASGTVPENGVSDILVNCYSLPDLIIDDGFEIPPGQVWTARGVPDANSWRSVTYGNGLFVAVSQDGSNQVMTSPDGITWTPRTVPENEPWVAVSYGGGLFVALSYYGTNQVMTSPDGITWTARNVLESEVDAESWSSVTYGNGLFVAVADTGTNPRVMTSPDGINWTPRNVPEANLWRSVTYGGGLFVAVARDGDNRVMTSTDGVTWTAHAAAEANEWYSVVHDGSGTFVAVSDSGTNQVMTSPDGKTWTAQPAATDSGWTSVTYGGGQFIAVAYSGSGARVMTSPNGISWTARDAAEDNFWVSVTSGDGRFVAVSLFGENRVMTSP